MTLGSWISLFIPLKTPGELLEFHDLLVVRTLLVYNAALMNKIFLSQVLKIRSIAQTIKFDLVKVMAT